MKRRGALWLFGLALLAGGLASGMAIAASGSGAKTVIVKKALNKKLGKTILVTGSGLTLYENTRERNGKIHCTGSCRTFWPPLLLPAGGKPTAGAGVSQANLGTLKRPDGGTQVTYKRAPLYHFQSDKKAGDVSGQGVKDLGGTWSAVVAPNSSTAPPTPPPTPPTTTTTGGYSY
jgi:predicted lipoprotein with Yx(FWY)xxD motif